MPPLTHTPLAERSPPVKPHTLRLSLALVALAELAPGRARCDMLNLSYSWSFGDTYLSAGGQGPITLSSSLAPDGSSLTVDHGSGTAVLTLAPAGTASVAPINNSPVILPDGTLATTSSGNPPGNFDFTAAINLKLNVADQTSGQSINLTLTGSINGSVSPAGTTLSANVDSLWLDPGIQVGNWYVGAVSQIGDVSTVPGGAPVPLSVGLYVSSTPPSGGDPVPVTDSPRPQQLPEPSALLLGALGALAAQLFRPSSCRPQQAAPMKPASVPSRA
jgi:hypothetical protein